MAITQKTKDPATGTPLKISGTREEWAVTTPHVAPIVLLLLQTWWYVMNEERTGLWLRQTEHNTYIAYYVVFSIGQFPRKPKI